MSDYPRPKKAKGGINVTSSQIPSYSSASVSFYRVNYFCLFEMAVIDQKGIQASAAAIFHVFCLDPLSFLQPDEIGRNQLMAQLVRIWDLLSRYNIKYI